MILEIAIFLILTQLVLGFFLWYQVRDLYRFPNSFGLPVVGNLYYFYKGFLFKSLHTLHKYLNDLSNKSGNAICFGLIKGKKTAILSCPQIIEEISYNPNASVKPQSIYGTLNPLVKGVFTYCPIDSEWKLRKKEMSTSMTKSMVDGPYFAMFVKASHDLVQVFKENQDNVDLIYHCNLASLNVVRWTHCGMEKPLAGSRRFFKMWLWFPTFVSIILANSIVSFIFPFTFKLFDKKYVGKIDSLREEVWQNVKGKLKDSPQELKYLPLSLTIALRNQKRNLRGFDMKKELYELLMVGSHTAFEVMVFAFAIMATHPEIQDKLWKEQYEIFGTSRRDPEPEDIKKMSYLDRFVKEALRFSSAGMIAKETTGEVKAGGVTIPAGTVLYLLLSKIRKDPKIWKDPHVFDPDRFLEDKPKYNSLVFGVGVKSCPGMIYGRQEVKIFISIIVRYLKLYSRQKFEDFKYESHLMTEIINLMPIQVEERMA